MINYFFKGLSLLALLFFLGQSRFIQNKSDFQGQATYISKSKMELGRWGSRMSEAQKKQVAARLKNRLEKEFTLTFNKEESLFISGQDIDEFIAGEDLARHLTILKFQLRPKRKSIKLS